MRFMLITISALATVAAPTAAEALSCDICTPLFTDIGGYPSNLELRASLIAPDVVPRVTPDTFGGFECAGVDGVDDMVVACRPRQTPAPGIYKVTNFPARDGPELTLTVSAESDDVAPDAPSVHRVKWNDFDNDPFTRGFIELIIDTTDIAPGGAEVEIRRPDGEVVFVASRPLGREEGNGRFRINLTTSSGACSCLPSFDSDTLPSDARLRVRLIDRAGNPSAWTDVVEPGGALSCTCVDAPRGSTASGLGLLLLVAVGFIRRRRERIAQ